MLNNQYIRTLFSLLKNKFVLSALVFLLILLFFDSNSLIDRFSHKKRIRQLEQDKIYYKHRIEETRYRIKELKTDDENLEKFAREQYLMKKENEDIFIIVEE